LASAVAVVTFLTLASGSLLVRDRYEASARVYVDTQTVLKPLMAGLTVQPDIDQQVRMLARTLVSRENVDKLLKAPGVVDAVDADVPYERRADRLMQAIKIQPVGAGNLYQISYRGASPESARRLVDATVGLFVGAGEGDKKRDSEEAGRFIDAQIRDYEVKLAEAENRLKDFKVRNFGTSGVSSQDYFARTSLLTDEVSKLRLELGAAERSRDAFRRELATEPPQLPPDKAGPTSSAAVLEVAARLEAQKKILDDLSHRYTDRHPDVASARRAIAELQRELRERRQEEETATRGRGATAATSPVYQQLRISLAGAEAQVASLRSQLGAKQGQLDQLRAAATRQPQIEAELAQLNRDYDVLRKNYEALVTRRESASLGLKLDESSQLATFRLIEPPRAAERPAFPSRVHLAALAALISLVLGLAVSYLVDLARPTIDSVAGLRALSKRPVLGSVSLLELSPEGRSARRSSHQALLITGVLVAAQLAWVVWMFTQQRLV
jgi:polysaccharide chain length determinant protein (PEP-CTERM system associated)